MITFYRTAVIAPGKTPKAMAWAREICTYIKDRHGVEVRLGVPIGGNPMRIGWSAQYDSLAAMEPKMTALNADAGYWEVVAKGSDCMVPGSVHDEIWQSV